MTDGKPRYPTRIQPVSDPVSNEKPMQINAVSKVSNYSPTKGRERDIKSEIGGIETPYRGSREFARKSDELDTGLPASLGEPDARGVSHLVGEHHPRAILSDADVELIRLEYEAGIDGSGPRIGYRALAKKWNTSKITVRDIVNMRRRNARPERWVVTRRRRRKPVV